MLALSPHRHALLDALRQQVRRLEKTRRREQGEIFSTGCDALDRLLPAGGWQPGMLVEWFTATAGAGAFTLALLSARAAARRGGLIVISDLEGQFYAPAAAALGIDPEQIVVLRPASADDQLWALDQSLRCEGVAMAWASLPKLGDHDFRRLQLATESGGTLGFLQRPARARGEPSWADAGLLVESQTAAGNRRLRVEMVRIRGGVAGASVVLEIDDFTGQVREATKHDETHPLSEVSRLAAAAARRRQA